MFSHISIWRTLRISKTLVLKILKIKVSWVNATFGQKNSEHLAFWGMVWALTIKLAPKDTVWAVISDHISSYFLEKIILITRIWRKSVFRVWGLNKLVHIKMSVFSLTELHTPCQTLSFSTVSKEQHLFQSVTRLNPVFQPILTDTIVRVNIIKGLEQRV